MEARRIKMIDNNEIIKELREMSRMLDTRLGDILNQLEQLNIAILAEDVDEDEDNF